MNINIIEWTKSAKDSFKPYSGNVLDIGSLNVNGTVKHLFTDAKKYTGIDFRNGKDVDMVLNAHDLMTVFQPNSFDTIICMDMIEHDDAFWITLENINKLLKKGGYLWVVIPSITFPIHNHPDDYFRLTEQAFEKVIYKGYKLLNMKNVYTKVINGKNINPVLCALGKKL